MIADIISKAHVEGPDLDLEGLLLPSDYASAHAARVPDRTALIYQEYRWSYAALDRAMNAMVTVLREAGVKPGDRVASLGRTSDLAVIVKYGVIRAGAVLVPINWRNTARETRYVLDDATPVLILADGEFGPVLDDANDRSIARIVIDAPGPQGLRALLDAAQPAPRMELDPDATCMQLYTSGTTGKPKGVLSSQRSFGIHRHIEVISPDFGDWGDDEVLLSPLPLFHVGGLSWVATGLVRGCTVLLTNDTAAPGLLAHALEHGVTRLYMVPTLVRAIIEEMDRRQAWIPTLRGINYGAASMDPALLERTVDKLGCKFLQYYGMTEITGTMSVLGPALHDVTRPDLLRSVGKVLPGFQIEIRDPQGAVLDVDQPGEIWVAGPTLMIGYWNRPEATAEALVDGWYRSGDGGRLNAQGYLFLTDRIKDMVVSGGENVYPAEVEAVLRDHPAILDCAVFGTPHPKWGEGVTAAIELRQGHNPSADDIIAYARESLAAYKIPRRILFDLPLQRTASGKVQRSATRQILISRSEE